MECGDVGKETDSKTKVIYVKWYSEGTTNQARARAISIAGNKYRFRVRGLLIGFCWNRDNLRVRVDSKLNHCMRTRLKKSVSSANEMVKKEYFKKMDSRAYIWIGLYL